MTGRENQASRSDRNSTNRRFNQADPLRNEFYHAEDQLSLMRRRNPKALRTSRNSKVILMVLILLLVGRNKIIQVQASCATDARNSTPRDMRMSAKKGMSSVMDVAPLAITR